MLHKRFILFFYSPEILLSSELRVHPFKLCVEFCQSFQRANPNISQIIPQNKNRRNITQLFLCGYGYPDT